MNCSSCFIPGRSGTCMTQDFFAKESLNGKLRNWIAKTNTRFVGCFSLGVDYFRCDININAIILSILVCFRILHKTATQTQTSTTSVSDETNRLEFAKHFTIREPHISIRFQISNLKEVPFQYLLSLSLWSVWLNRLVLFIFSWDSEIRSKYWKYFPHFQVHSTNWLWFSWSGHCGNNI